MVQHITQVDAFTDTPFGGNPAAVCVLPQPGDPTWMQRVAQEMNLAETAFLHRQEDGFNLRWFTPTVEVDLCGHATLASAHVLWEEGRLGRDQTARFHTRSGLLTATYDSPWIELNFPAAPAAPVDAPSDLIQALGVSPTSVGKALDDYLVEVDSDGADFNDQARNIAIGQLSAALPLLVTIPLLAREWPQWRWPRAAGSDAAGRAVRQHP